MTGRRDEVLRDGVHTLTKRQSSDTESGIGTGNGNFSVCERFCGQIEPATQYTHTHVRTHTHTHTRMRTRDQLITMKIIARNEKIE